MDELKTVLVAMDESEHSFHALEWALNTLIAFQPPPYHYRVVLLHAKLLPVVLGGPGLMVGADLILSMEKARDREIEKFMNKALELCVEKQVVAEAKVGLGDPRDVICEMAEKLNANFLVIGSHSYGAIKRAVLGSVSDYCAHHSKCPVIIVKKPHKITNKDHATR